LLIFLGAIVMLGWYLVRFLCLLWVPTAACTQWWTKFKVFPFQVPMFVLRYLNDLGFWNWWYAPCSCPSLLTGKKLPWFPIVVKLFTKVNNILFSSIQQACLLWYWDNQLWSYIAMFYSCWFPS
jgi:hypothetical protein